MADNSHGTLVIFGFLCFSAHCSYTNAIAHNCNRAMHESRAVHCAFPSLQKPGCNPTEPQRYRVWTVAHSQPQIKLIKQNNNGRTKQGTGISRSCAECFGRINTKVIIVSDKHTLL